MAELAELVAEGRPLRSVEIWPARSESQAARLAELLDAVRPFPLDFLTVTYGARGSARAHSLRLVEELSRDGWPVVAHLACLGHSRPELIEIVRRLARLRLVGVLALRGDPPLEDDPAASRGPCHARDLVELIRAESRLSVAVALHPDGHPDAASRAEDRVFGAEKLAMADLGFTQFFFEDRSYVELVHAMRSRGVNTPVVPGFMLPTSRRQLTRMAEMAGIAAPDALAELPDDRFVEAATQHVEALATRVLTAGAPGLHLFSMNQPASTTRFLTRFPA